MPDRLNPEALFLEHLGWIDKVAALACRKYGMRDTEAEDFASWIKIELTEDDYAVFRNFRGEGELKTYLATVVVRLFHEYVRKQRGGWHPVIVTPDPGAAPSRADERVAAAQTDAQQGVDALVRVLEQLAPEDRIIVKMHFADGRTLAEVARALHLEQKQIYRRLERLRMLLRQSLEAEGVRGAAARRVLEPEAQ